MSKEERPTMPANAESYPTTEYITIEYYENGSEIPTKVKTLQVVE